MNKINNSTNQTDNLLVGFALSLQKHTDVSINEQQLYQFISNEADLITRQKVISALNASPGLMQQWIDICDILEGSSPTQEKIEQQSLLDKVIQFIKQPWLVPAFSFIVGLVILTPVILNMNNETEIPSNIPQISLISAAKPHSPKIIAKTNQQTLFLKAFEYRVNNPIAKNMDFLCVDSKISNCPETIKLASDFAKLKTEINQSCGNNLNLEYWNNINARITHYNAKLKLLKLGFDTDVSFFDVLACFEE